MAHTNSWDETNPTNTTLATDIDDHIRKVRLDIRERMAIDHKMAASDAGESQYGVHTKVTFEDPLAEPTLAAGESCLYPDDGDLAPELRYLDSRGLPNMLTWVGEVRMVMGTTVPIGWLSLNGETIGDGSSGADNADADMEELFTYLWTELADGEFAISTGRGGSAAADWASHKTGTLPDSRSRVPMGEGTGSGLTARTIGATGGVESFTVAAHTHTGPSHTHTGPSHTHTHNHNSTSGDDVLRGHDGGVGHDSAVTSAASGTGNTGASGTGNTGASGGITTESVINPFIVVSMLIKY